MELEEIKHSSAGEIIRYWRQRCGFSQMDLALESETSTRHLSCIETGRVPASKKLLQKICEVMDLPMRARNVLLIAGGFAPSYLETGLSETERQEVHQVLEKILYLHEPYPAMLIDRCWNIVLCNRAFCQLVYDFSCAPVFTSNRESWNLLRLMFYREGWADCLVNMESVYKTMMGRAKRMLVTGDPKQELSRLIKEIAEIHPLQHNAWLDAQDESEILPKLIMPIHLRKHDKDVSFLTTMASLGSPQNIILQELQLESGYPADDVADRFFKELIHNKEVS